MVQSSCLPIYKGIIFVDPCWLFMVEKDFFVWVFFCCCFGVFLTWSFGMLFLLYFSTQKSPRCLQLLSHKLLSHILAIESTQWEDCLHPSNNTSTCVLANKTLADLRLQFNVIIDLLILPHIILHLLICLAATWN